MNALSAGRAAEEAPERVALVSRDPHGPVGAITYAALASRVTAARARLAALGVEAGARVGVRAVNSSDTVVALLALVEMGATCVPVHPRLTDHEARSILDDAGVALVLGDDAVLDIAGDRGGSSSTPPARSAPPPAPLGILYTSGTTGRAKGAVLSRRAFVASAAASAASLGWRDDDRWLLALPICHIGGLSILTRSLLARRAVIVHPRFDADAVLSSIVDDRATLLSVVPTMLARLLASDRDNVLARLRAVLVGGAAAPLPLLARAAERGVEVLTTYGLTEACSQVTAQRPRSVGRGRVERGSGPPLPGVDVSIVYDGGDAGRVCAPGVVGEILVRGGVLMDGYWNAPAPWTGDGWLRTGDFGAIEVVESPHGRRHDLHVVGRRTDLIVTGGENVYPAEVEEALTSCDGVAAAVVFGVPDDEWGEIPAAVIAQVPAGAPLDDARIADALALRLARFKWPRRLAFTTGLDALPTTASGKLDRAAARTRFSAELRAWSVRAHAGR